MIKGGLHLKIKPGPLFRNEFFGAPYKLGGQSKEEGFDCFSWIYCFYKRCGFDMPDGVDGVLVRDYVDLWNNNNEDAKKVMWNYFNSITESVPNTYVLAGDTVIIKYTKDDKVEICPGIYLGNNSIGLLFEDGGIGVWSMDLFDISAVRRCIGARG